MPNDDVRVHSDRRCDNPIIYERTALAGMEFMFDAIGNEILSPDGLPRHPGTFNAKDSSSTPIYAPSRKLSFAAFTIYHSDDNAHHANMTKNYFPNTPVYHRQCSDKISSADGFMAIFEVHSMQEDRRRDEERRQGDEKRVLQI